MDLCGRRQCGLAAAAKGVAGGGLPISAIGCPNAPIFDIGECRQEEKVHPEFWSEPTAGSSSSAVAEEDDLAGEGIGSS